MFLIADIGTENLLLGYLWLATFKPGFKWQPAIMDSINFPVIISSSIPSPSKMVIASLTTEDKMDIMNQLEEQCMVRGIAMELAIQASEGKKKVECHDHYATMIRTLFLFSYLSLSLSPQFPFVPCPLYYYPSCCLLVPVLSLLLYYYHSLDRTT